MLRCVPVTDYELLDAWSEGDRAAGNELFHRYFSSLYPFFRTKMPERAEDLTQETFLACIEGRERFARRSTFKAYLFGTARNILCAEIRKQRRLVREPDWTQIPVVDAGPSPSGVVGQRQQQELLLQALRRIPLDYQIAIELYRWESLTGPELACVLGLTEPALRSRLRRANDRLREELQRLESDPALVESTMAGLSDWARQIRARLGRPD